MRVACTCAAIGDEHAKTCPVYRRRRPRRDDRPSTKAIAAGLSFQLRRAAERVGPLDTWIRVAISGSGAGEGGLASALPISCAQNYSGAWLICETVERMLLVVDPRDELFEGLRSAVCLFRRWLREPGVFDIGVVVGFLQRDAATAELMAEVDAGD